MNLECINGIITKNLAIHIDLTDERSWNLNTGLTSVSITKWKDAVSDNLNLRDFGLTAFDVGRTNEMWSGIKFTPNDTKFTMYRIAHNDVINPTPEQFSGLTATTNYDTYPLSAVTTGDTYFDLNGGYLQGFFKLDRYNYELFPSRYCKGITIETMLHVNEESSGIFYMMGVRAEDKYNKYYQGEFTRSEGEPSRQITGTEIRGIPIQFTREVETNNEIFEGVNTSNNNFLESFKAVERFKKAFRSPEQGKETVYEDVTQADNLKNNVIAFEITEEKNIKYKYVGENGLLKQNTSDATITNTGFTLISITYTPEYNLLTETELKCEPQRLGTLIFYVNGRLFWRVKDFPEFFFRELINDEDKQIGVPYSISWGGGSFGLKHSWHYDKQTYLLYDGQITEYIQNNFVVKNENDIINNDLILSADNTSFTIDELPLTLMRVEFTGSTGHSSYVLEHNTPITVLSNRDYVVNATINKSTLFDIYARDKISLIVYSYDSDIEIIDEIIFENGGGWGEISTTFRLPDNVGRKEVYVGIKIESSLPFRENGHMFVMDLNYTGADILVQDETKQNLFIEQNFNSSFIGGIQKLRIYDNALTSSEILHNAIIESNNNSLFQVNRGGRLIFK